MVAYNSAFFYNIGQINFFNISGRMEEAAGSVGKNRIQGAIVMDPIVSAVVTVLGKYAIDKGVELTKEAGPKAAEAAGKLFQQVVARFRKNPADAQNLERFEQKPESYQAPVADALEMHLKTDPAFAAEIKRLLAQYQTAAPQNVPGSTIISQIAGDNAIQFGQVQDEASVNIDRSKPNQ
jgi:hypothetical protein